MTKEQVTIKKQVRNFILIFILLESLLTAILFIMDEFTLGGFFIRQIYNEDCCNGQSYIRTEVRYKESPFDIKKDMCYYWETRYFDTSKLDSIRIVYIAKAEAFITKIEAKRR